MDDTRLLFQKSEKYPDQVAVMASFFPTFTSAENTTTRRSYAASIASYFRSSIATKNTSNVAITAGSLEEQDLPK